jgi:cytochrome c oxidase assembly protein subunit 15
VVGLLAVTAGQAVLGYLQYGLGVPAGLVALHVLGSAVVWSMAVALVLKSRPPRWGWRVERAAAPTTTAVATGGPGARAASRPVLSER